MTVVVTQFLVAYSVIAAPILLLAYLRFLPEMEKSRVGKLACIALLGSLAALQCHHWMHLVSGTELFERQSYVFFLLSTPPSFFFFCREVLVPGSTRSWLQVLHFLPLAASFFVPTGLIAPLAFVIGAVYAIWFALFAFGMRRHVRRFAFEMFFFGFFALLAVIVLMLAVLAPTLGTTIFYFAYADLTGLAFVLLTAAMLYYPDMLSDISDAARLSYANSTLGNIDIDERLAALERTMDVDKLYQNEDLTLSMLATAVELTPHQLSELVNSRFGYGFSRYVRERRITEAKRLLLEDPQASVLSVGLTTGFRSQSNFYAAFRDIVGESPGAWRKNAMKG